MLASSEVRTGGGMGGEQEGGGMRDDEELVQFPPTGRHEACSRGFLLSLHAGKVSP